MLLLVRGKVRAYQTHLVHYVKSLRSVLCLALLFGCDDALKWLFLCEGARVEQQLVEERVNPCLCEPLSLFHRVSVLKFRPIYIAGEVEDPGQYAFVPGMTVQQAIVLAGGDTPFASDKYYLQRGVDSKRIRVDAGSILFPGDVITVGERVF